ncbi:hypothetical protein BCF33_0898 [Hasllibacter halocynthiae]|uniref:TrgA family protein n=1 Tax=Hasllibacter halocynthiae TaxID=595589 RepID=A0A2T0X8K7_9RHOB|nr:TrgA family protein [Hasllibacter halocynthiae]PRY95280.1 hypothetical protein BCF33_0898 [Hasllibacter halocynthiae]
MPTPAKFLCAFLFAGIGFATVWLAARTVPPEIKLDGLNLVAAGMGLTLGWKFVGSRVGEGLRPAMAAGLTAGILLPTFILAFWAWRMMLIRSLGSVYADPLEAVNAAISLAVEHAPLAFSPALVATVLGGGVLAGLLANRLDRAWG